MHLTLQIKEEMRKANTDRIVIPGGLTSQLQVLDVVVNKPFKYHLQQLYSGWLLKGNHALTPGGKLKKPSRTVLGEWILTAWGEDFHVHHLLLDANSVAFPVLDGTEYHFLWQDAESVCEQIW
jgi:hypothetical protein